MRRMEALGTELTSLKKDVIAIDSTKKTANGVTNNSKKSSVASAKQNGLDSVSTVKNIVNRSSAAVGTSRASKVSVTSKVSVASSSVVRQINSRIESAELTDSGQEAESSWAGNFFSKPKPDTTSSDANPREVGSERVEPTKRYIARYAFEASNADEINLNVGDIVLVDDEQLEAASGWMSGRLCDGKDTRGLFPAAYVVPTTEDGDSEEPLYNTVYDPDGLVVSYNIVTGILIILLK